MPAGSCPPAQRQRARWCCSKASVALARRRLSSAKGADPKPGVPSCPQQPSLHGGQSRAQNEPGGGLALTLSVHVRGPAALHIPEPTVAPEPPLMQSFAVSTGPLTGVHEGAGGAPSPSAAPSGGLSPTPERPPRGPMASPARGGPEHRLRARPGEAQAQGHGLGRGGQRVTKPCT